MKVLVGTLGGAVVVAGGIAAAALAHLF